MRDIYNLHRYKSSLFGGSSLVLPDVRLWDIPRTAINQTSPFENNPIDNGSKPDPGMIYMLAIHEANASHALFHRAVSFLGAQGFYPHTHTRTRTHIFRADTILCLPINYPALTPHVMLLPRLSMGLNSALHNFTVWNVPTSNTLPMLDPREHTP